MVKIADSKIAVHKIAVRKKADTWKGPISWKSIRRSVRVYEYGKW